MYIHTFMYPPRCRGSMAAAGPRRPAAMVAPYYIIVNVAK